MRAEVAALLAIDFAFAGDHAEAKKRIEEAEQACPLIESSEVRAKVLLRVGIAKLSLNYPADSVMHGLLESAELAESVGMLGIAARAFNVLGMAQLFYLNAPAEALKSEKKGSTAAIKSADRFALHSSLAYSVTAETQLGNLPALEPLLLRLSEAATSDAKRDRLVCAYTRATMCAWNGQFHDAAILMDDLAASNYGYYDFDQLFNIACHALYEAAAEQDTKSRKLLALVSEKYTSCNVTHAYGKGKRVMAVLFAAMAECFGGRRRRAKHLLRNVPLDASSSALALRDALSAFCSGSRSSSQAVSSLIETASGTAYAGVARTLAASMESWELQRQTRKDDESLLTPSEKQILVDLEAGHNPKEIAAQSGRSVHTVRTLVQRAIRKLGCSGRNEALAVARRSGILTKNVSGSI